MALYGWYRKTSTLKNNILKGIEYHMIIKNPQFEISAVNPKQYPQNNLPQIVLVGKSNVGKSSFINTMVNRKKTCQNK